MAILSDTVGMVDSWTDGEWSFDDVTAPIAVGTDLLAAALDPVGALIAAPLGELLEFCVHNISFIREPLEKLEGSDAMVEEQKKAWENVGKEFVAAGQLHAAGATDMGSWKGEASETYHELLKATNKIFQAVEDGCQHMGMAVEAAGMLVGMLRGFIWDMITELLTAAIEAGIAALAAAVPTVGASLAAFATWYTGKVGAVGIKIFKFVDQLLERAEKFASKSKTLVKQIKKARDYCQKAMKQLAAAKRLAGKSASKKTTLDANETPHELPKGVLPGDTTVGHKRGSGTSASIGPLDGGDDGPYDFGDSFKDNAMSKLKGDGKDIAKTIGKDVLTTLNDESEIPTVE